MKENRLPRVGKGNGEGKETHRRLNNAAALDMALDGPAVRPSVRSFARSLQPGPGSSGQFVH